MHALGLAAGLAGSVLLVGQEHLPDAKERAGRAQLKEWPRSDRLEQSAGSDQTRHFQVLAILVFMAQIDAGTAVVKASQDNECA